MSQAQPLPKSSQSIQDILHSASLPCAILTFPAGTKTAIDPATAIGCNVGQIVKSLIFKTKTTHRSVLALTSGANRVNEKTLAFHIGEEIVKADADFTRTVTGFAIGGIPPIGHQNSIDFIFIDEDLLVYESVWAAAGTPHTVFELQTKALVHLTRGTIIQLAIL